MCILVTFFIHLKVPVKLHKALFQISIFTNDTQTSSASLPPHTGALFRERVYKVH